MPATPADHSGEFYNHLQPIDHRTYTQRLVAFVLYMAKQKVHDEHQSARNVEIIIQDARNEAEANQSWDDQMYSNPQYQRHMNQRGQPLHERCAKEASLSCLRGRDSSLHQVFGALVRNQKGSHIPRHHRQDFTSS